MTTTDTAVKKVTHSGLIGDAVSELGWKIQFSTILGDNLTHTHRWTYRNPANDIEVVFWMELDYSLSAAVKYRVYDSATAFPVAGTHDIDEALKWLEP